MATKDEEKKVLRTIHGAIFELLVVQEKIQTKVANQECEHQKLTGLLASLDRRMELLKKQLDLEFETEEKDEEL